MTAAPVGAGSADAGAAGPAGHAGALLELTKPGITRLVLVTTAAAFAMASPGWPAPVPLLHTLIGTGLAAGGTNALNEVWESEVDGRMRRTRGRPIPSGRVSRGQALAFALACSVIGIGYLLLTVDPVTAGLVALSLTSYVFVYTPLKRRTWLATLVGAVPGALPIAAGWTAAGGRLGLEVAALFAILFAWQLPHFFSLAWIYRDDYRRGGLRMLPVLDVDGRRTARHIAGWAIALVALSAAPAGLRISGVPYLGGALALGAYFAAVSVAVLRDPGARAARRVFFASILYLPALLALMVLDKAIH
ncbi:MAG: protoheme IX farnesyltransferase [Gemmatimonadetes bacterium]|nr:protoheme IX farnesyltransferase [Gemmatimonadota bacterium]